MLTIDAMKDKIRVNNQVVMDKQIRDHDAINVFFEPQPRPAVIDARPVSEHTVIHEREIRTEPRSDLSSPRTSDSTITVSPEGNRVTVQGGADSKVTVQPKSDSDSKVTIERGQ